MVREDGGPHIHLPTYATPISIPPTYKLADVCPPCIGILHTIFFHRFFPSVRPRSREVLDITLPFVDDVELDTMIEKRAAELARELDAERTHAHSLAQTRGAGGGRGNVQVQFFEKKRRKTWYMRAYGSGDEEVCWESWTVKVTVAEPRTDSGMSFLLLVL